jgi:hypothetical protein
MASSKVTPLRLLLKELQCFTGPVCLVSAGGCHALAVRLPDTAFLSRTDHCFLQNNVETFIIVVPIVSSEFNLNAIIRK